LSKLNNQSLTLVLVTVRYVRAGRFLNSIFMVNAIIKLNIFVSNPDAVTAWSALGNKDDLYEGAHKNILRMLNKLLELSDSELSQEKRGRVEQRINFFRALNSELW